METCILCRTSFIYYLLFLQYKVKMIKISTKKEKFLSQKNSIKNSTNVTTINTTVSYYYVCWHFKLPKSWNHCFIHFQGNHMYLQWVPKANLSRNIKCLLQACPTRGSQATYNPGWFWMQFNINSSTFLKHYKN